MIGYDSLVMARWQFLINVTVYLSIFVVTIPVYLGSFLYHGYKSMETPNPYHLYRILNEK